VQGSAQAVEAMRRWAAQGPPGAGVSGVEVAPAEGDYRGFELRPSA
jgi:acylphosphatase